MEVVRPSRGPGGAAGPLPEARTWVRAVVPITWPAGPFVPVGLSEPVRSYVPSVRDSAGSGFRVKLGHQPGTPLPAAKPAAVRPG